MPVREDTGHPVGQGEPAIDRNGPGSGEEEGMKCSCGHMILDPRVVGLQRDKFDEPVLVLHNCPAYGSTRAIPIRQATVKQLGEAYRIEQGEQKKAGAV